MDKDMLRDRIAARVAKELHNGDVVNLGIGIPTAVPQYLPKGIRVVLQAENGIIGSGPVTEENRSAYVWDAGAGEAALAPGGCFCDSFLSFSLMRGGHLDATVLGALQVDLHGNLANWMIPGKKIFGMGGAMDLVVGARRVIVAMEHTNSGKPKILRECTLPLTAVRCVNLIVTEMGVIRVMPEGLVLEEISPEFTVEAVRAATEAPLLISKQLKPMYSQPI